jgi:hypothetical protein
MKMFHDAELVHIDIDRILETVSMTFVEVSGGTRALHLDGVVAFRCEDMTIQNVVSRVLQYSLAHFTDAEADHWMSWATSLSDAGPWLLDSRRREWMADLKERRLELLVVEPSAGAQIAAVCRSTAAFKARPA